MRRTYRSKKDTGGVLDHRDVLQNMDEKSSVFDAFYIQNIKQTKRELSCVTSSNHTGVASNRVRKRKYVKRIVKDVENVRQRDTMSPSAYLTPDKSIRVNKVLDPFDMLLNSSPVDQNVAKTTKNDNNVKKFIPRKQSKTYTRKRQPKLKKFNYSSSESNCTESDKENTTDLHLDYTDIRTHNLIIEKESRNGPKHLDESIKKIVNNLSLLNNLRRKVSNDSFNTSYKSSRNRLTKNIQSPILQKSPICSTPFKEKYRGISIYKFSPIFQKDQVTSPNYVTEEEKDNSIILVSKQVAPRESQDHQASPLTHILNVSNTCKPDLLVNEMGDNFNDNKHEHTPQSETEYMENDVQTNNNSISKSDLSSFQTIEAEPFFGFSKNLTKNISAENICLVNNILEENKAVQPENDDLNETELESNQTNEDDKENTSDSRIDSNKCNTSQSSLNSQNSVKGSLYDTCSSEQSSLFNYHHGNKEPVVAIERINNSLFMKYYEKMKAEEISDSTDNDFESLANDSNDEVLNNSLSTELDCIETKTNAIEITDSSITEDVLSNEESNNEETGSNSLNETCVNFVTTRRRNEIIKDSMFIFDNSYGSSSSTDCDKTVLSNLKVNLEKLDGKADLKYTEHNLDDVDSNKQDYVSKEFKLTESPPNEVIPRKSDRKSFRLSRLSNIPKNVFYDLKLKNSSSDKRISKVTTRKSSKLSRRSYSRSPVFNCSKNDDTFVDAKETNNKTVVDNVTSEISNYFVNEDSKSPVLIAKNTSGKIQERITGNCPERPSYAGGEVKPCIVLQPGKKWERSLSIYRRMTMVADHFNQSHLEDECPQKKGRKYRQSVIDTMEMQEYRDSLHNDSINSRRSTFMSKPSRPPIRFVKDPNFSRVSLSTSPVLFDDLKGFLNEECDDTVIELSKLSIADSEHEITILDNFHETERVATARDYVLRRCNQTEPILFDECYPETVLKNCHKIGEGVYGEVFLWRGRDGRARVMKIVPIAGTIKVNGEDQKDFHEIISEIVIAMELSALRAPIADIERQLDEGNDVHALDLHAIENATDTFNEVLAVRCVYGAYPSRLLDLWELYDECKGSENDSPAALPIDQRYIVLELANAGQDLESYQFAGAQQAHALFQQIAFGLAVAEEAFQFEHRDLHWGNVLIAPTEQKFATFVLRGRVHRIPRCGVAATIIDYSLSRLSLPLAADSAALYNDLAADEQLFDAVGDYQFEVYRLMREKVGNDWKNFEPYTNILWLHYTVDKMITALRYKRTNTKIHKHYIEKLKGIKDRILEYGSAVQYVLTDIEF